MTDKQIAEKLIRFVISCKYYDLDKQTARNFAREDLADLKTKYGWRAMKKAYIQGRDTTTWTKYKQYVVKCLESNK
jgi:hypothetical protein